MEKYSFSFIESFMQEREIEYSSASVDSVQVIITVVCGDVEESFNFTIGTVNSGSGRKSQLKKRETTNNKPVKQANTKLFFIFLIHIAPNRKSVKLNI